MNKRANHKVANVSVSTLLISSGIQMYISKIEPTFAAISIWLGIILLLTLGIIQVYERVEELERGKIN